MSLRRALDTTVSEKAFQNQVIQFAELNGWAVYHTYDSRRCVPGWPDLVLVRPPVILIRELKREKRYPTADQRRWLDMLAESGQDVAVWRPGDWPAIEKELGR